MVFFWTLILNFISLLICTVIYIWGLYGIKRPKLKRILQLLTITLTMLTNIVLPTIKTEAIQQNIPIPITQSQL